MAVALNLASSTSDQSVWNKTRFVGGPWESLKTKIPKNTYDIILMSETLYNTEYYPSLVEVIDYALS